MKNFSYHVTIIAFICLLSSCSFLEDDGLTPIEKERLELEESVYSYKVLFWKYMKMAQKAQYVNKDVYPELLPVKEKLGNIENLAKMYNKKSNNDELSALDYVSVYKDFTETKDYIKETDEDILPSILEFNHSKNKKELTAEEKELYKSGEHFLFSAAAMLFRDLGREIALYEITKVDMEKFPEGEEKCLYRLFRSMLFLEKGMIYLTEEELTQNINYIANNKDVDFTSYYLFLYGKQLSREQAKDVSLSINYLLRGVDRLIIGGEKEQGALDDFQAFLDIANKLGVQTELTLAIETYLHLKNEDSEKAIVSLLKLKESNMLSDKEKKSIDEAIEYLKDREPGKVLNSVYDKYFLSKIVMKYSWNKVKELDWRRFMKERGFENADVLFDKINTVREFVENIEKYTTEQGIKEAGKELKEGSEELWDKAKNYWNEN
ncbi:short-chain dehydrogenase [uncultured Kordia sp.]|uniref:short-chain dehydrogenase n=1 Tax=uncultured Kordia sp. TaxID=507699 RepID=UPI00261FF266|nr:short-chain dehydrogenase [uncultured Kordia sp.]